VISLLLDSAPLLSVFTFFLLNATAPTAIYTLSLHDALPISVLVRLNTGLPTFNATLITAFLIIVGVQSISPVSQGDLNLVRLLRSEEHTSELHHVKISYAVFCLKKKKKTSISKSYS